MTDKKPLAEAWLAFDIGCIECGESSAVIGIYGTKSDADANLKDAEDDQRGNWNGQHHFEVFDVSRSVSFLARNAVVKELRDLARQDQLAGPWLNARASAIERGEQ